MPITEADIVPMGFIRLTSRYGDDPVFLRVSLIAAVVPNAGWTYVSAGQLRADVKETSGQIVRLMAEAQED